jgi:hypothetical protein
MAEEEKNEEVYFTTILRKDTFKRLSSFAKQYSTGLGKWDYGVAFQILLDFYEQNSSVAQTNIKLDIMMSMLDEVRVAQEPKQEKEEVKDTGIEMLGGEVLRK